MLEVLPEDITASPRSVPLGMFDSRTCEFSFGEKFLDSAMEDSPALPVFIPVSVWRCACKNEALVQCIDSLWHSMIVCKGSVIRAYDCDQLWYVLGVTSNSCDWQDWSAIDVSGVQSSIRAARVSTQSLTSVPCIARCDLRFQNLRKFSAERGFPNCGAWHFGKLVTELDILYAGCKPRGLSSLLVLLMTWVLPYWTEQHIEEVIYNRGVKVPHRGGYFCGRRHLGRR